jgi:hypothetical protein
MSLNAGDTPLYSESAGNHPCKHKGLPSSGIPTFTIRKDKNGNDIKVSRWFYCTNKDG